MSHTPASRLFSARPTYSRECETDIDVLNDNWLTAGSAITAVEMAVIEIERETQVLRGLDLLKPFVEGEPIGKYVRVRRKKPTPQEIAEYHAKRREWRRQEMLALRAKNNADMEAILNAL